MARLTFVAGKGGVGKTTVSCALALHLAAQKPRARVLLMSTDPAHSLADMLQVKLKSSPSRLAGAKGKLFAWQIDSDKEFQKFLAGNRDAILNIVESGTFFSKAEIAPLLDTTLPGMAEVAGLLSIQEMVEAEKYGHIIVDTAPFGHTLRLFELPGHFQRFLDFLNVASCRDELLARRFGGRMARPAHAFLERWQDVLRQLREAFSAKQADICLVTSPETFSLNEAARSLDALSESVPEMKAGRVVLNRVTDSPGRCEHCRVRAGMAKKAQAFLKRRFPRLPVLLGPDPGNPILGIALLKTFGDVVFAAKKAASAQQSALSQTPGKAYRGFAQMRPDACSTKIKLQQMEWPRVSTPLSFTVGKGGVGKTTVTAALAFHARLAQKVPVTVCSTDPAPSLDDIFQKPIGDQRVSVLGDAKFAAVELDSIGDFNRWAARIKQQLNAEMTMQSGGVHVDLTFEREVFSALLEVVPPGVDEIFAIFRILGLLEEDLIEERHPSGAKAGLVLIDMAPTGHALELLRMPERVLLWSRLLLKSLAAHRTLALAQDVAVELASLGQQVRRLIEIMRNPKRSRVFAVMLPEPVPDQQTERLLKAVRALDLGVDSLFVNRVLAGNPGCERCEQARQWQQATIEKLAGKYPRYPIYIAREFPGEIAGAAALKRFTGELWRIA
ncbi:MAG TPA: ArsA family ATPase [Verrucomicrobiae bacterium]|nr:ArsA family ATPase [Verrucomicrobiae bacterium]